MAPRHRSAQHESGAPGGDRQAGAGHHGQLPRGRVDRDPKRPARRRHGHGGFLQRRVLRAAAAPERLAQADAGDRLAAVDLGRDPLADETRTRHRDERRPGAPHSRHHLELFAEHPRQRAGGFVRGQGRQFPQDLRPGPRPVGAAGRARPRTSCKASRASPTWASSTSAGRRTWSSASIPRSARSGE